MEVQIFDGSGDYNHGVMSDVVILGEITMVRV